MVAPLFEDRADATRQLIAALPSDIDRGWLVLALPRGGVPIAAALARHLGCDFDVLVVRKVGVPDNPELAVAAVTGPGPGGMAINLPVQAALDLSETEIAQLAAAPLREVEARRRTWSGPRDRVPLAGRDVLIVDDGAATGTTLEAALIFARAAGARSLAVAVPVAIRGALDRPGLRGVRVISPYPSARLPAVGTAYRRFPQITDREVRETLAAMRG